MTKKDEIFKKKKSLVFPKILKAGTWKTKEGFLTAKAIKSILKINKRKKKSMKGNMNKREQKEKDGKKGKNKFARFGEGNLLGNLLKKKVKKKNISWTPEVDFDFILKRKKIK